MLSQSDFLPKKPQLWKVFYCFFTIKMNNKELLFYHVTIAYAIRPVQTEANQTERGIRGVSTAATPTTRIMHCAQGTKKTC